MWDRENKVLKTKNEAGAAEAAKLYQDALDWIDRIIAENRFQARGIYGFFPANSDGDDIIVWADETRTRERCRFHTLRQQIKKDSGKPNVALADWVAPADGKDYIGGFVVGIHGADEFAAELGKGARSLWLDHGQGHRRPFRRGFRRVAPPPRPASSGDMRRKTELTKDQLIHENYRGIRPAPGYPAQPDHTEKPILFDLLRRIRSHRRDAHRKLRDASRRGGLRAVFLASGKPLLRDLRAAEGPGGGLRAPQGHDARPRRRNGSARGSATCRDGVRISTGRPAECGANFPGP